MHIDTSISSMNIIFHAYWPLFNQDFKFDTGVCGHDTDILWLIPCGHQNRTAAALQARSGPHDDDDDDVYYYIRWRLKPQKRQVRTSDSQGCAYLKTDLRLSRELDHENGFHVACITPVRPFRRNCDKSRFLEFYPRGCIFAAYSLLCFLTLSSLLWSPSSLPSRVWM